jgi:CHASE3 domain sensor protein
VVLLLLCVITAMSYTSLLKVNHSYSDILDNNIQIINDAQEIQYQPLTKSEAYIVICWSLLLRKKRRYSA